MEIINLAKALRKIVQNSDGGITVHCAEAALENRFNFSFYGFDNLTHLLMHKNFIHDIFEISFKENTDEVWIRLKENPSETKR